jgi:phospholipid/cholesterol/gamma-HCH transport system substrate-binding protein
MMRRRFARSARFVATIVVLAVVGVAAAAYVLIHERFPVPFGDTYNVTVVLPTADGVAGGFGEPVNVSGVNVGSISGARLSGGNALVTLSISRDQLPHIYRDASATLAPITPLKDMEIELDPGRASAGILPNGGTVPASQTTSPTDLEELLSSLDTDTRTFLGSLITSVGAGTDGRGMDLRRTLVTLGPTTAQVHAITSALAQRRSDIELLVHNLAVVTRAASQDGRLGEVVQAGNATLNAIAQQDTPLRQAIAQLPATLAVTDKTLGHTTTLADELGPTLTALTPAVRRLPRTFSALGPFAARTTGIVAHQLRPFTLAAQPLVRDLRPAVARLSAMTPDLQSSFMVLDYLINELAYNPGGDDPGMLFWSAWTAHNLNSFVSVQDANGGLGRTLLFGSCSQLQSIGDLGQLLESVLSLASPCHG